MTIVVIMINKVNTCSKIIYFWLSFVEGWAGFFAHRLH